MVKLSVLQAITSLRKAYVRCERAERVNGEAKQKVMTNTKEQKQKRNKNKLQLKKREYYQQNTITRSWNFWIMSKIVGYRGAETYGLHLSAG